MKAEARITAIDVTGTTGGLIVARLAVVLFIVPPFQRSGMVGGMRNPVRTMSIDSLRFVCDDGDEWPHDLDDDLSLDTAESTSLLATVSGSAAASPFTLRLEARRAADDYSQWERIARGFAAEMDGWKPLATVELVTKA